MITTDIRHRRGWRSSVGGEHHTRVTVDSYLSRLQNIRASFGLPRNTLRASHDAVEPAVPVVTGVCTLLDLLRPRYPTGTMGKLRFKETERDREDRRFESELRSKRKERERAEDYADLESGGGSRKRRRSSPARTAEDEYTDSVNYERHLREAEERHFRARLFDEMGVDERQDDLQDTFGGYHVPDRWASSSYAAPADPRHMTDDEYTEWVREGMWKYVERHLFKIQSADSLYRRTHAKEAEEQERKRAERAARKARESTKRRETKRLEAELRRDSDNRREQREHARKRAAVDAYVLRWSKLSTQMELSWAHVPWPTHEPPLAPDAISLDAVREFLLDTAVLDDSAESQPKDRRQKLKEALLLWHPDRFEGRWLTRIADVDERDRVREAVGVIARHLNQLMEETPS